MIISISNQKGGVGKTTTALNLSGGLALRGYKTLLVDVDPQASATFGLLEDIPKNNLAQVFTHKISVKKIMIQRSENFYLLPASMELAKIPIQTVDLKNGLYVLKNSLKELEYMDFIIIDTPPNSYFLSQNAWTASDNVIIPVHTEYFSLHGLTHFIEAIDEIQKSTNSSISKRILPTMYDMRKRQHNQVLEIIQGLNNLPSFKTVIRTNSKLSEAPSENLIIQEYDKSGHGSVDYNNLIEEILEKY